MEIRAKLIEIGNTTKVSEKFQKREFVVEYTPEKSQYQEYLKFEIVQDKCEMMNTFKVGENVEVHFNLKGRKWVNPKGETVYFNSLQAWRVINTNDQGKEENAPSDSSKNEEKYPFEDVNSDDIPF